MSYLSRLVERDEADKGESLPAWVSKSNASYAAFYKITELKEDRENYIRNHNKPRDYKLKRDYQISISEMARALGMSDSSFSTATYTRDLKAHLSKVNTELAEKKEKRVTTYLNNQKCRGMQLSKDTLRAEHKVMELRVKELKEREAIDLFELCLNQLNDRTRLKLTGCVTATKVRKLEDG